MTPKVEVTYTPPPTAGGTVTIVIPQAVAVKLARILARASSHEDDPGATFDLYSGLMRALPDPGHGMSDREIIATFPQVRFQSE